MLGNSLFSKALRSAALFAAVAVLLAPFPGRCAACVPGTDRCSQCVTANAKPADDTTSTRACCQQESLPKHDSAKAASHNTSHNTACGCNVRPLPRTTPVEKTSISVDHSPIAALPTAFASLASQCENLTDAFPSAPSLNATIPHRILHCSWII